MKKILISVMALMALSSAASASSYEDYENYVVGGNNTPQATSIPVSEMKDVHDISTSRAVAYADTPVVSSEAVHYGDNDIYDISSSKTIRYGE